MPLWPSVFLLINRSDRTYSLRCCEGEILHAKPLAQRLLSRWEGTTSDYLRFLPFSPNYNQILISKKETFKREEKKTKKEIWQKHFPSHFLLYGGHDSTFLTILFKIKGTPVDITQNKAHVTCACVWVLPSDFHNIKRPACFGGQLWFLQALQPLTAERLTVDPKFPAEGSRRSNQLSSWDPMAPSKAGQHRTVFQVHRETARPE